MDRVHLEISWATLWRILFFIIMVLIFFLGRNILLGLFIAIVISSGLERPISYFEKRGLPRALGAISVFVSGIALFILVVYLVVPLLIADINTAITGFNKSIKEFGISPFLNEEVLQSFNSFVTRISVNLFSPNNTSPLAAVSQVLGGLSLAAAVFVSSFYLSLSKDGVQRFLRTVLPTESEDIAVRVYERSRKQIGLWFRTQILLSFIVGVLVTGGMFLLGVKHALLIGILAALFEIVPYVGPILAGAIGILVALTSSAGLAFATLLVFLGIQQLENHFLVPVLMRRSVGLHPVIVIIALLIGAEVLGFIGIIIAVPAAAMFQEIVDEWSSVKKSRASVVV